MAEVTLNMPVERELVWELLVDPTTYPDWLVGAVEMLEVEDGWPRPGSGFRHRFGLAGPVTVVDHTEVVEVDAPELLVLLARARPFGRARVTFELRPEGAGSVVTMRERPVGLLAPTEPVSRPFVVARNRKSLGRLRDLSGLARS